MTTSTKTGVTFMTISSIVFMISGYLVNIFLGRFLGPVNYGIYGIIISLITIINLIQTAGLPQAVSKYVAQNEEKSDAILKSGLHLQIASTIVITIIYFLLALPIAYILNDLNLISYLQFSALIFPAYGIYALYAGYYNGLHSFRRQATIGIFYSTLKTLLVLVLGFFYNIYGALIGFILSPFLSLLSGIKVPRKNSTSFSYKKLIMFSIPLIGFAFLSTLLQSIDLYFVKALLSSDKAPGYYTANQNISKILFAALSAFSVVIFPKISRELGNNQTENIRSIIHMSLRIVLIFLIPGTFLIATTSEQIIQFLYSNTYSPAAPSLTMLIFASGFLTLFTLLSNILNGAGMPNKSLFIAGISLLITALFCILLIPTYGLIGAALATSIGSFIAMLIATYFVYKRFRALVPIISVIKITLASLLVSFLAYVIKLPNVLLPLIYVILFLIYFSFLFILKEFTRSDLLLIGSLLPDQIRRKIKI